MKIAITNLDKKYIETLLIDHTIHIFVEDVIDNFSNSCFLDNLRMARHNKVHFVFDKPIDIKEDEIICENCIYTNYDRIF